MNLCRRWCKPARAGEGLDPASFIGNLLLVLFLVFLNGFFVAAEFAMVKVRSTRLDTLLQEGNGQAKMARQLVDHLDAYLSACQLGITLASLGLGWVGEPAVASMISPVLTEFGLPTAAIHTISFGLAFSFITALHIIIGELAPKSLAIQKAESVTLLVAWPLRAFYRLMYPFIWALNSMANSLLRLGGISLANEQDAAHTEEEIRILMEESHRQGYIDRTELTFVDNIFDFAERNVRDVMVPRTDMVCLYLQDDFAVSLDTAVEEKLTRYPVCDPDKDHIVGFVHIKDMLQAVARQEQPALRDMMRQVLSVPESMPLSDLLRLLQRKKLQLAIVVDEYGGTAGLVTVEDILEEIVGEIQDEFDEERPAIEMRGEDLFSVDGRLILDEVNDALGAHLESEDVDTLGGWLYSRVEIPPRVGQTVQEDGYIFKVEECDGSRITRVLVRCLPPISEEEEGVSKNA